MISARVFSSRAALIVCMPLVLTLAAAALWCHVGACQVEGEATLTYRRAGVSPENVFPAGFGLPDSYFPDRLGCFNSLSWSPPPDQLLGSDDLGTPSPLAVKAMVEQATSVLSANWLPESFDAAVYLQDGEGAYRGRTAHMCLVYRRGGCAVVLRSFPGTLNLMIAPLPPSLHDDLSHVLLHARELWNAKPDPCQGELLRRGRDDADLQSAGNWFEAAVHEVVAPAAGPSGQSLKTMLAGNVAAELGGIDVGYLAEGPISDPGAGPEPQTMPTVHMWTNGRVLRMLVTADPADVASTALFAATVPTVRLDMDGLPGELTHVLKRSEWTDDDGSLVRNRAQASRERVYILSDRDTGCEAHLPLDGGDEAIRAAAWLHFADIQVGRIVTSSYRRGPVESQVRFARTGADALAAMRDAAEGFRGACAGFEGAPCPECLADVRQQALVVLSKAKPVWDVALREWEEALEETEPKRVNVQEVSRKIAAEAAAEGGAELDPRALPALIRQAQQQTGIWVTDWWHDEG